VRNGYLFCLTSGGNGGHIVGLDGVVKLLQKGLREAIG